MEDICKKQRDDIREFSKKLRKHRSVSEGLNLMQAQQDSIRKLANEIRDVQIKRESETKRREEERKLNEIIDRLKRIHD